MPLQTMKLLDQKLAAFLSFYSLSVSPSSAVSPHEELLPCDTVFCLQMKKEAGLSEINIGP